MTLSRAHLLPIRWPNLASPAQHPKHSPSSQHFAASGNNGGKQLFQITVNDMDLKNELSAIDHAGLAKQRIFRQPHLAPQRIWSEYDVDRLFLRGQVPSFYHKQLAQEAILGMVGVDHVVNEIEVVW